MIRFPLATAAWWAAASFSNQVCALQWSISPEYLHQQASLSANGEEFRIEMSGYYLQTSLNLSDHWSVGLGLEYSDGDRTDGNLWYASYNSSTLIPSISWQNNDYWASLSWSDYSSELDVRNNDPFPYRYQRDSSTDSLILEGGHDWYVGNWQIGMGLSLGSSDYSSSSRLITRTDRLEQALTRQTHSGTDMGLSGSLSWLTAIDNWLLLPGISVSYQHSLTGRLLSQTASGRQESTDSGTTSSEYASTSLSLSLLAKHWSVHSAWQYPLTEPHDSRLLLGVGYYW